MAASKKYTGPNRRKLDGALRLIGTIVGPKGTRARIGFQSFPVGKGRVKKLSSGDVARRSDFAAYRELLRPMGYSVGKNGRLLQNGKPVTVEQERTIVDILREHQSSLIYPGKLRASISRMMRKR